MGEAHVFSESGFSHTIGSGHFSHSGHFSDIIGSQGTGLYSSHIIGSGHISQSILRFFNYKENKLYVMFKKNPQNPLNNNSI